MALVRQILRLRVLRRAFAGIGLPLAAGLTWSQETLQLIRAVEGLRFDPPRLTVTPGTSWRLRFENADTTAQPHNLLVLRPGTRESVLAAALALGADGPVRGYVPAGPDVLAASRLLAAGEEQELSVRLPDSPGIYPIVCTFPGHGVLMFGALYAGVEMPVRVEDDPHVPKPPPPVRIDPDPRPMVRRIFLPYASPAAVAVALPGNLNLCWDASPCRLRYVWQGEFLSADQHFEGKGQALPQLGGPVVLTAPSAFPLRFGGRDPKTVAFRGYALVRGLPEFEYTVDDKLIKESFYIDDEALIQKFHLGMMPADVEIRLGVMPDVSVAASRGTLVDGVLRLTRDDEATEVTVRYEFSSAGRLPPIAK